MEFSLTRRVLESHSFLKITESEYLSLVQAKDGLLSVLTIEEKFDLLVENYLELESSLLDSTARGMVLCDQDYKWFQLERNLFNRRLANLLSACRSYIDFALHYISVVLPEDQEAIAKIKSAFHRHYDECLGYRVMEALRNYVQHCGFPVHAIDYSSKWLGKGEESRLRFGLSIFTKTVYLREDGEFKSAVLSELEKLGGRVDLKPFIREYITALSAIHDELRDLTQFRIKKWDVQIDEAIHRFKVAFPNEDSSVGLVAIKRGDKSETKVQIFGEFIEYRRALQQKNRSQSRLDRCYVTSEFLESGA